MIASTFVNIVSILTGLVAGLFFCLGSAELRSGAIRTLAGTYWDHNPHLRAFLVALKADYLCGAIALCLTFLLQFFAAVPGILPSAVWFAVPIWGTLAALALGGIFGSLLYFVGRPYVIRKLNAEFTASAAE